MYFKAAVVFSLICSAVAAPAAAGVGTSKSVLTSRKYADFQVSDGVAGNALAEVNAKFPVCF
jgi:hypothetical protein